MGNFFGTSGTDSLTIFGSNPAQITSAAATVPEVAVKGNAIARELAMANVAGTGDNRNEALRIADSFRGRVIYATTGRLAWERGPRS